MYFTHSFTAGVSTYDFGKYFYTVVYVPAEVTADLPLDEYPRLRVEAEVDEQPIEGALTPDRLGSAQTNHLVGTLGAVGTRVWYLMVPRRILQKIGKAIGDDVEVHLRMADQDAVDVPPALADRLAESIPLSDAWSDLTPGKQRAYAHRVASAKRAPTIEKRLLELEHELLGDSSD